MPFFEWSMGFKNAHKFCANNLVHFHAGFHHTKPSIQRPWFAEAVFGPRPYTWLLPLDPPVPGMLHPTELSWERPEMKTVEENGWNRTGGQNPVPTWDGWNIIRNIVCNSWILLVDQPVCQVVSIKSMYCWIFWIGGIVTMKTKGSTACPWNGKDVSKAKSFWSDRCWNLNPSRCFMFLIASIIWHFFLNGKEGNTFNIIITCMCVYVHDYENPTWNMIFFNIGRE